MTDERIREQVRDLYSDLLRSGNSKGADSVRRVAELLDPALVMDPVEMSRAATGQHDAEYAAYLKGAGLKDG